MMTKKLIFPLILMLGLSTAYAKPAQVTSGPAAGKTTVHSNDEKITSVPEAIKQALAKDGAVDAKGTMEEKRKLITAKQVAKIAQMQLQSLTAYAMKLIKPDLVKNGTFSPVGAMVYRDGRVSHLVIKNEMPATDKIKLYRYALRSLARHDKIDASVVIFSAEPKKNSKARLIVMNYEHRFGVSGTRVIAYKMENGKLELAPPKDLPKNFFVFYDQNRLKSKSRIPGNKL